MIDIQHGALCAPEHYALSLTDGVVQEFRRVRDEGAYALCRLGILVVHLDRVQRVGPEQGMGDSIFLITGVFNVRLQQAAVQQINDAQAAAVHLVFIRRTDAAAGGADLLPSGSIFRSQLDHAMVRQDHLGTIRHKELFVDIDPEVAKLAHFCQKGEWVEHYPVADDGAAIGTQNTTRDQLQDKLLAPNNDRMAGIVAAGIPGDPRESVGKNVNDLSLPLVAPLAAHYYCSLGSHERC